MHSLQRFTHVLMCIIGIRGNSVFVGLSCVAIQRPGLGTVTVTAALFIYFYASMTLSWQHWHAWQDKKYLALAGFKSGLN